MTVLRAKPRQLLRLYLALRSAGRPFLRAALATSLLLRLLRPPLRRSPACLERPPFRGALALGLGFSVLSSPLFQQSTSAFSEELLLGLGPAFRRLLLFTTGFPSLVQALRRVRCFLCFCPALGGPAFGCSAAAFLLGLGLTVRGLTVPATGLASLLQALLGPACFLCLCPPLGNLTLGGFDAALLLGLAARLVCGAI